MTRLDYFLETVRQDTDECISWPFARSPQGYGVFTSVSIGGYVQVHRLACERFHGEPAAGMYATHTCRDRACYNPRHLRWGTARQNNVVDRQRDGTYPVGVDHPQAVLTEEQVRAIRERVAGGESQASVCRSLGVAAMTVNHVVKGRTWVHLM